MKDYNFLVSQIKNKSSCLCVGLDPDPLKMPDDFAQNAFPLYYFSKAIVELTHEFAVAFKINVAFFESYGPSGWEQLAMTLSAIPKECLIILDAKRADIGNTSAQYAHYFFEDLNADGVTLHPYMGLDSLQPFLQYSDKWSAILALTSNPGWQKGNFFMKKSSTPTQHTQIPTSCLCAEPHTLKHFLRSANCVPIDFCLSLELALRVET
jgi:orotidine-5'-phosphate decarboxylase